MIKALHTVFMKELIALSILFLVTLDTTGQNCSILSKANDITPDRLCSPVTASWNVRYTGVNDGGSTVSIRYDWDNGTIVTVPAVRTGPGIFQATASVTYTSIGERCNYHPQATLIVNGVLCTSSTQEQIVTVWDNDDHNGGHMHISPTVYPICVGNGDNVRFQDLTQFNCVPPQENDNPNVNTRWVQWIYGTDITMTGIPVTIDGWSRTFPYSGNVIMLPGPVTGSGIWSDVINVASDKLVGQYFQVRLRNWNYCNPYDDPAIAGPPRDRVNGDHPPVETTAIILIVDYPDATINRVAPMCANAPAVTLSAHDDGGTWSGSGIRGNTFYPAIAGPGTHLIRYSITNGDGCSSTDTALIRVLPIPDASIVPPGVLCANDPPVTLLSVVPGGTWSGVAVTGNIFNPSIAGAGNHDIRYDITLSGCSNYAIETFNVATPDATINSIDTLCINGPPVTLTAHDQGGIWMGDGVIGDKFYPLLAGAGDHVITYDLNNPQCTDTDTSTITVVPVPVISINPITTIHVYSPQVTLTATPAGGLFSGNGVTGSSFNPAEAGVGKHVITYQTLPDKYGCSVSDTIHIKVIIPPPPTSYFLPDTTGCGPLTVKFRNLSTEGDGFIWDFGDGLFSMEQNPVHTYYISGKYIVRLTVKNVTGTASYQSTITVFQNPTAIFNVYPIEVITNSQIVTFYNYSLYSESYLWDFGDGKGSTEQNPWHKYEAEGTYNVKLTVTSDDGCIDSTYYTSPVVVKYKTGDISFPNAFRWNRTGPTGGYWSESQMDDAVFRPFFTNILDYKLQIFNRWGVLIYESTDLHKGWDGYFGTGNLATQGVYVWKAKGQYSDGSYFNKVGDVTFLH